jgi:aryl-alcohol dehydrogenase-like predicted oxidoreductase
MKKRTLGKHGPAVSAIGLGCMSMTQAYGPGDEAGGERTLLKALDLGINFFDTAEIYGPYENERLLGRVLAPRRQEVVIATKFGFRIENGRMAGVDSSPANVRRACEASLQRLGTDYIDLLYQHRVDPEVPIEDTVGAMAQLVQEGKVRHLGLSEASASTLKRAYAVHPIAALQSEYSLYERSVEGRILDTCRQLGVTLVPYSPLGRGLLTPQVPRAEAIDVAVDYRARMPRFQGENFDRNRQLLGVVESVAQRHHASLPQVALAWVMAQGDDIIPIPGTKDPGRLAENAAAASLMLTADDIAALSTAFDPQVVAGERYPPGLERYLDKD